MITIDKLAAKARKYDWKLTNEESIQVFQLLPEGCERFTESRFLSSDMMGLVEVLRVKGLGSFVIQEKSAP